MNKKPTYADLKQRISALEEAISKAGGMESAFRKTEEKFVKSFLKSPIPMAITSMKDGRYVEVNEAFMEGMGRKREELIGNTSTGIGYITAEQRTLFLEMYRQKGFVENLELQIRTKGGELRYGLVNSSKITIGCEDFFLTIVTDITERKWLEEELLKVKKLESVGTLAGGIAHDFNNLLAGIHGYLEMAKMDIPAGTRSYEYLLAALQSTQQAAELTKRIITFSKGGGPLKLPCDIGELVKDTVQRTMIGVPVEKKFIIADDLWSAEVDEGQIRQVISNIIVNAAEAMPEGGLLTVSAENVTVSLENHLPLSDGQYLRITVKDTGGGISAQDLPLVFDPYFSTKQRGPQKGMGLGLSVCYSILSRHAGCIVAESKPGEGSTFYIYLPALVGEKSSEKLFCPEITQSIQKRILVMDDEEVIRDMTGQLLQTMGYQVATAQDGLQAIDLYLKAREENQPYGMLILDLTIKNGMGGVQTLNRLREIDPGVKAIIFSGFTDDPVIENYSRYGFLGAITKPFKREELKAILERHL